MSKTRKAASKKVQVELGATILARVDELLETLEAASVAEVIRTAIRFLHWFVVQRREGYDLFLRKGDELIRVELPSLLPKR